MRGHIDKITTTGVTGWTFDPATPSTPLEVRLLVNGEAMATTVANLRRKDVAEAFGTNGLHGFELLNLSDKFPGPQGAEHIRLEARVPGSELWRLISEDDADQEKATKHSVQDKAERLQLKHIRNASPRPDVLSGLSVLQIGCGDGIVCGEAFKLGAKSVTGIDPDIKNILVARERVPEATFIRGGAWDIPAEKFDVILFINGLELEPRPRALLEHIQHYLSPEGTLILESGLANTSKKNWFVSEEDGKVVRYPNRAVLFGDILHRYAWRHFGTHPSVGGSSVPRVVLHCRHKRPTAMLITGPSRSGKTTLSMSLDNLGCPVVALDGLMSNVMTQPRYNWSPLAEVVRTIPKASRVHFGEVGKFIVDAGLCEEFAELIVQECPRDSDVFAIEGEILRHDAMYEALLARLEKEDIKTWVIALPSGRG